MPDSDTGTKRGLERWVQLAGLWTLAICLPVLQVLADSPDYLVAEHAGFPDLPLTVIGYVLVPPSVAAAVIWVAGKLDSRVGDWLQAVAVGALVGAFALQVLKEQLEPTSRTPQLGALIVAVAVTVAYRRTKFPSAMATVLAPAALLVPLWFLLLSPVAPVARGGSGPDQDGGPPSNGTPVVLVVFDEFSGLSLLTRDGRMDSKRVPNLARLNATWFKNATTVADTTVQAVPAIVSGQVKWGELPVTKDYPRNLFSLLDDYRMHTYEPITNFCANCQDDDNWSERVSRLRKSIWRLTEQRLRRVDPQNVLTVPFTSILDRDRVWREWTEGVTGGRTLNFLHIELPHTPWWFDPSGRQYTYDPVISDLNGETWPDDSAAVARWKDRYLQQVRFTDRLVGDLRRTLERKGIWDEALVIFVADHGVAFQPGMSRRFVGDERVFPDIASVPLFVKAPGQESRRVDSSFVRTTDVLATVGDYLGLDWPGRSLRTPTSRSKVFVARQSPGGVTVPVDAFEFLRAASLRGSPPER